VDSYTSEIELSKLQTLYQEELEILYLFLNKHQNIWSQEVLNHFPKSMESYDKKWLVDLDKLTEEQEWRLDCGSLDQDLSSLSLYPLLKGIKKLESIPKWIKAPLKKYPSWAFFKVGEKKEHEIKAIISTFDSLDVELNKLKLLDIGGGQGHLSRILCHYHGASSYSLDANDEFQELGKKRLNKYPTPEGAGQVSFIHHRFGAEDLKSRDKEFELFNEVDYSIGLHTCGPLANSHIKRLSKGKGLLNFGCCYQLLSPGSALYQSAFVAKQLPLKYTKHALTLATRGHSLITLEDYRIKKQVKFYRGALHFLIQSIRGEKEFLTVGSSHPREYFKPFASYALLKEPNLMTNKSDSELNDYYNSHHTQSQLKEIYKANLIRWRFGRLLEKFIILDRALSLVESGHKALVYEFFDQRLSPRNLGILVKKGT